jgi:hypothetical protein
MSFYLIWVPALIILTALWAVIGKHVNENPTSNFFYFLFFAIPVWAFVSKYSRNLLFDSTLYDIIMSLVYFGTFLVLGCGANFSTIQWVGAIIAVIGLCLMKIQI